MQTVVSPGRTLRYEKRETTARSVLQKALVTAKMPKLEQIFKYLSATEGEFVAFLYCIKLG